MSGFFTLNSSGNCEHPAGPYRQKPEGQRGRSAHAILPPVFWLCERARTIAHRRTGCNANTVAVSGLPYSSQPPTRQNMSVENIRYRSILTSGVGFDIDSIKSKDVISHPPEVKATLNPRPVIIPEFEVWLVIAKFFTYLRVIIVTYGAPNMLLLRTTGSCLRLF
jgi:hypothetical protein